MAYPDLYDVTYSYTGFQQSQGDNSFPGTQIDADFAGLEASIANVSAFVEASIRSDGRLQNGLVTADALSPQLLSNGLATADSWVTGREYFKDQTVYANAGLYRSTQDHLSGVFATDLAAGKWVLLTTLPTASPGGANTQVQFNNGGALGGISGATTDGTKLILVAPAISNPTGLVKANVGLGNVDNTSDAAKNTAAVTLQNKTINLGENTVQWARTDAGAAVRTVQSKLNELLVLKDFGVKADGVQETATVSITTGTKNLTKSTGAPFTAADVGKTIFIEGAGAAGAWLQSSIVTFTDATHVVINDNAGTTLTAASKRVIWGSDDATGITAAITAARVAGATLLLTGGMMLHSTTLNWAWNNLHVMALSDDVVFLHTGAGVAHQFNGINNYGGSSQGCVGGRFGGPGRPVLRGSPTAGTTVTCNVDNWHFGSMKVAVRDGATAFRAADGGVVGASAVFTDFDIDCAGLAASPLGAFIVTPNIAVDATKLIFGSLKLFVEGAGVGGFGGAVQLKSCVGNVVSGVIESCPAASPLVIDSGCIRNTFQSIDLEANAAGWNIAGTGNSFYSCVSNANSTGDNISGSRNHFQNCKLDNATITNTATANRLNNCEFTSAFFDNGINTTRQGSYGAVAPVDKFLINGKAVSDLVGAGPVVVAADVNGAYVTKATGVNFNSGNTDTALPIVLPAGFTRFFVLRVNIGHASQTLTTSTFGVFSGAAGAGLPIVAGGTACTVSTAADATVNNAQSVAAASAEMTAASLPTPNTIYFRVGTPQGAAATGNVAVYYLPLP